VLKETFDDVPGGAITPAVTDDAGYLNGTPVGMAVFHHDFQGAISITPGGDTTPTTQPPGQVAQELSLAPFGPTQPADTISIHPYLPPGASTA
jgi:hypothetical protein